MSPTNSLLLTTAKVRSLRDIDSALERRLFYYKAYEKLFIEHCTYLVLSLNKEWRCSDQSKEALFQQLYQSLQLEAISSSIHTVVDQKRDVEADEKVV